MYFFWKPRNLLQGRGIGKNGLDSSFIPWGERISFCNSRTSFTIDGLHKQSSPTLVPACHSRTNLNNLSINWMSLALHPCWRFYQLTDLQYCISSLSYKVLRAHMYHNWRNAYHCTFRAQEEFSCVSHYFIFQKLRYSLSWCGLVPQQRRRAHNQAKLHHFQFEIEVT